VSGVVLWRLHFISLNTGFDPEFQEGLEVCHHLASESFQTCPPDYDFQAFDTERTPGFLFPCSQIYGVISIVVFHEKPFIIPTKEDVEPQPKKVEAYDPHSRTFGYITEPTFLYFSPKAVVLDDKIIVYENGRRRSG
ncbi:hypothetical protein AVEN_112914-1, partial [Araneus ventricosus]